MSISAMETPETERTGVWNEVRPEVRDNEVEDPGCRFRRPFFGSFFGRTKKEHKGNERAKEPERSGARRSQMNNRSLDEQRTEERSDELGAAKEHKGNGRAKEP